MESSTSVGAKLTIDDRLVNLLEEQGEVLKRMMKSIETMERYASQDHSEEPLPERKWNHEHIWRAVFETAIAKTLEQAELWKNGMDANLIFIALFVTVVTAFQVPVSQNLTANPAVTTNEILNNLTSIVYQISLMNGLEVPKELSQPQTFRPAQSDEIVTMFWYTSLIMSVMTAILAVFGRQWVAHLTRVPKDKSFLRRSMRHKQRKEFAERFLIPLLDSLHPTLVISIALFVVGLLYQLWTLAFSGGKSNLLVLTSSFGSFLTVIIAGTVLLTFSHSIYFEESPFAIPLSTFLRRVCPPSIVSHFEYKERDDKHPQATQYLHKIIPEMVDSGDLEQMSSLPMFRSCGSTGDYEGATSSVTRLLESDTSLKTKISAVFHLTIPRNPASANQDRGFDQQIVLVGNLFDSLYTAYTETPLVRLQHRYLFLLRMHCLLVGSAERKFDGKEVDMKAFYSLLSLIIVYRYYVPLASIDWKRSGRLLTLVAKEVRRLVREGQLNAADEILSRTSYEGFARSAAFHHDPDDRGFYSLVDTLLLKMTDQQISELLSAISTASQKLESSSPGVQDRLTFMCLQFITLLRKVYELRGASVIMPRGSNFSNITLALARTISQTNGEVPDEAKTIIHSALLMDRETLAAQRGLQDLLCLLVRRTSESYDNASVYATTSADDEWIKKAQILLAQVTSQPDDYINSTNC